MNTAKAAFFRSEYGLAKELYAKATTITPNYATGWQRLAEAEIMLAEKDSACAHFYKSYSLKNDDIIIDELREYCPDFKNGTIYSLKDVDEKPTFSYQDKEYPLYIEKAVNPIYSKLLKKELKKISIVNKNIKSLVAVRVCTDKMGLFNGSVIRIILYDDSDTAMNKKITDEIHTVLRYFVKYNPAKHIGKIVDLYEKPVLQINLAN